MTNKFNEVFTNVLLEFPHYDIEVPTDMKVEDIPKGSTELVQQHLQQQIRRAIQEFMNSLSDRIQQDRNIELVLSKRFGLTKQQSQDILLRIMKQMKLKLDT